MLANLCDIPLREKTRQSNIVTPTHCDKKQHPNTHTAVSCSKRLISKSAINAADVPGTRQPQKIQRLPREVLPYGGKKGSVILCIFPPVFEGHHALYCCSAWMSNNATHFVMGKRVSNHKKKKKAQRPEWRGRQQPPQRLPDPCLSPVFTGRFNHIGKYIVENHIFLRGDTRAHRETKRPTRVKRNKTMTE